MQTISHYSGLLAAGLNGYVDNIPSGYKHRTILVAGDGIHSALEKWGMPLRKIGCKDIENPLNKFDITNDTNFWRMLKDPFF